MLVDGLSNGGMRIHNLRRRPVLTTMVTTLRSKSLNYANDGGYVGEEWNVWPIGNQTRTNSGCCFYSIVGPSIREQCFGD